MSFLDAAQRLQAMGFEVFPLLANTKDKPLVDEFYAAASSDFGQSRAMWTDPVLGVEHAHNIAISTTRFRGTEHLIVVDVDNKEGGLGNEEVMELEMEGKVFPPTFTQQTPTGGFHLVYKTTSVVGNSVGRLASHIDIRAHHGYIVGAGSEIDGRFYESDYEQIEQAPAWLEEALRGFEQDAKTTNALEDLAQLRAKQYLLTAPVAVSGAGGNHTTFKTACQLRDFGVDEFTACDMLWEYWNPRCEPPWSSGELNGVVENAYRYGKKAIGSSAPESAFQPIPKAEASEKMTPIEKLNLNYAFVIAGGGHHILWETIDVKGKFKLEHLNESSFHKKFASHWLDLGTNKKGDVIREPLTKVWMSDRKRRSYDNGFTFAPGRPTPDGYYNLFHGYAVTPYAPTDIVPKVAQDALAAFLDHARVNVCGGDEALLTWLLCYFAHLIQRPWEKPLVALVFKGGKGVGKNALVDRVGHLLGIHYFLTSDPRYLLSNFNGHLENKLLFVLNEAFWGGDKRAESTLKELITGNDHVIEHKGKEPYTVPNLTRIVIIGNEEWLVPASEDERRFAVFNVGDGRKQDGAFFQQMREGMEAGGYRLLLRYFFDFDLSKANVNQAPKTQGLTDQKVSSLSDFKKWWMDCLDEGTIVCDIAEGWPERVAKNTLRDSFRRYQDERKIGTRLPDIQSFGRQIRRVCPGIASSKTTDEARANAYVLPNLDTCRAAFEKEIGSEIPWN